MKIALLIKQVPDTRTVRMDEKTGTVVRDGNEAIVNPLDLYALKAALDLKAAVPGSTITAISMGPANAEKALKEALTLGADEALLICDRAADLLLYKSTLVINHVPNEEAAKILPQAIAAPNQKMMIGLASHEQYSFPYYFNYQPDHLARLGLAARIVTQGRL